MEYPISFDVCISRPGKQKVVLLGVTSIVPSLGGVLFLTEDKQNYQLDTFAGHDAVTYTIEYPESQDDFPYDSDGDEICIDHRNRTLVSRIVRDREDEMKKLSDWYDRVFACIVGRDEVSPEMILKLNRVHERQKAKIEARFIERINQVKM